MEWVKCSDRMPEMGKDILAYVKDNYDGVWKIVKASYYDKYSMKNRKPDYQFHEECNCCGMECDPMIIDEVTHWCEFPPMPKEK